MARERLADVESWMLQVNEISMLKSSSTPSLGITTLAPATTRRQSQKLSSAAANSSIAPDSSDPTEVAHSGTEAKPVVKINQLEALVNKGGKLKVAVSTELNKLAEVWLFAIFIPF